MTEGRGQRPGESGRSGDRGRQGGGQRGRQAGGQRGRQGSGGGRGSRGGQERRASEDERAAPGGDRGGRDRGNASSAARRADDHPRGQGRPSPSRKPQNRPAGRSDRRPPETAPAEHADRGERTPPPPGLQKRADEPRLPADLDTRGLPRGVKAELRGLPKDLAEVVAGHLVLAGQLIDDDPALAHRHAEAARRRAARLPVVREAAAETAYAAGHWDVALSEFRALRRMTGTDDFLPVMADCERALGRPQAALKIAKEARRKQLDPALAVEMIIVESGARSDLGQQPEARRVLHQAILEIDDRRAARLGTPAARLYYAYADALERAGQSTDARRWFDAAAGLDTDGQTDADERRDLLDGMLISFDDSEPEDGAGADSDGADPAGEPGR